MPFQVGNIYSSNLFPATQTAVGTSVVVNSYHNYFKPLEWIEESGSLTTSPLNDTPISLAMFGAVKLLNGPKELTYKSLYITGWRNNQAVADGESSRTVKRKKMED